MSTNIFITGFSGTGKSTVAKIVAERLGWVHVDTDDEIIKVSGKSIAAVFREDGETRFRQLEHETLGKVCQEDHQVVSTGGGIVMDSRNRSMMESEGVTICLEATPHTIYQRLAEEMDKVGSSLVRPLLEDVDPLARIITLKAERQANYILSKCTVHTDGVTPEDVADEVLLGWRMLGERIRRRMITGRIDTAAIVRTSYKEYPVWVGWGILKEVGERVRELMSPGVAYIVSDEGTRIHGRRVQASLESAGIPSHVFVIPPGENSKSLEMANNLYSWLAGHRAERGHLILAVGGGVVGDLAGYVAATFLRGIHFGQVPTTLLGMMDSSIGGKTGVDLPEGKNLVGVFHQPKFVMSDVETLKTLPSRELSSGWAEAIKHGLILDENLLKLFENKVKNIALLDREISIEVIRRSCAIKSAVVSKDEFDVLGLRVLLNYGHTIGHAIETVTGYSRFLHGEAVSIGMMGAAFISNHMGMLSDAEVDRQRKVLEAFKLPISLVDVDIVEVSKAMQLDKKMESGSINWVLLEKLGRAVTSRDVEPHVIQFALRRLQG